MEAAAVSVVCAREEPTKPANGGVGDRQEEEREREARTRREREGLTDDDDGGGGDGERGSLSSHKISELIVVV